jgi:hypothetical protein
VLLAGLVALAVLTAGCIAQDRPHHPTYTVVADAGGEVVASGESAHLHWAAHDALEPETPGEHLDAHAEIEWEASSGAHAAGENFTVPTAAPGLTLVEVNVTAENHSAKDIGGVLAVPGSPGARRAFVGVVGDVELALEAGTFTSTSTVTHAGHSGHFYAAPAPGATVRLRADTGGHEAQAQFLISIKSGSGTGQVNITEPLVFAPGVNYTLVLETTAPFAHRIEVDDPTFGPSELSLSEFAEASGGAAEGRLLVAPPGQTLPDAGAAAAGAALAAAALMAASARRRR